MNNKTSKQFFVIMSVFLLAISLTGCINASNEPIDSEVIRDLEIFGSLNQQHPGFSSHFDTTSTQYGKASFTQQFKQLPTDVNHIRSVQKSLKFLVENPEQHKNLLNELSQFGQHETAIDVLQGDSQDPVAQNVIEKFYFGMERMQHLNHNASALSTLEYARIAGIVTPLLEHMFMHYGYDKVRELFEDGGAHDHHHHHHGHDHGCFSCLFKDFIRTFIPGKKGSKVAKHLITSFEVLHFAFHIWSMVDMYNDLAARKAVLNVIYQELSKLSVCAKSMNSIVNLLAATPELRSLVPLNGALASLFTQVQEEGLADLMKILSSDYFSQDDAISIMSPVGETLRIYKLLKKYAPILHKAYEELGFIDSVSTIATYMKNHQDSAHDICFVDFITDSSVPSIQAKGLWNPVLGDKAVSNDLTLGGKEVSKIIITGPNKSGKTTAMKTVALNLLLAHWFGIAMAQSFTITPFNKILTCIDVPDDVNCDQSKFVAALIRAEKILKIQKECNRGEFAFIILDDSLLDGTTVERRDELSYKFVRELGSDDQNILLVATHLPRLTLLEDETQGWFKNYRINLTTNSDGKKQSTYQLIPGISPQERVFDIIEDTIDTVSWA